MAVDIALDEITHDLKLSDGFDLILINDRTQFTQRLRIKLKIIYGEWFRKSNDGIKYFDNEVGGEESEGAVFVKNPNLSIIESMYKATIMEEPESEELLSFSLTIDGFARKLTLEFTLMSSYGEIDSVIHIGGDE